MRNGRNGMQLNKWDIPVNFTITATTEQEAEQLIIVEIYKMLNKRGLQEIVDFELIEYYSSDEGDVC